MISRRYALYMCRGTLVRLCVCGSWFCVRWICAFYTRSPAARILLCWHEICVCMYMPAFWGWIDLKIGFMLWTTGLVRVCIVFYFLPIARCVRTRTICVSENLCEILNSFSPRHLYQYSRGSSACPKCDYKRSRLLIFITAYIIKSLYQCTQHTAHTQNRLALSRHPCPIIQSIMRTHAYIVTHWLICSEVNLRAHDTRDVLLN